MQRSNFALIAVSLFAAVILITAGIFAARRAAHPSAGEASVTSAESDADEQAALQAAQPIDPAMIGYHEAGTFAVDLKEPRALAVDSEGQIYVGGDRAVLRHSADGKQLARTELQGEPRCLAVAGHEHLHSGRCYVGMEDHVEVYDPRGTRVAVWSSRGPAAILTSITTTESEVWVADAGNRLVWRFDTEGKLLQAIGRPDPAKKYPGFVVTDPHHYFDLAAGADGLVYVVNPRLLRVEGYTQKGEYETAWGKCSSAVEDFFGCCNPAQLAVLPGGGFVTAEKGMPRVKIYSQGGQFETVVAGPAQLAETPRDLAADGKGRVLVLVGRPAKVRVFEKNSSQKDAKK